MNPAPKRDRAILIPGIGAQLISNTSLFIVPVLLDALQRAGLSGAAAGSVFSLELVVSALTTLLVPVVCPPHSFRRGALLGGALAILGTALTMVSPAFAGLIVARSIAGFGAGLVAAEATMVVARGFDRERLIAILTIVSIVNAACWLAILPYVLDGFGYRGPYGCLLLICLAGTVLLTRLPSPTRRAGGARWAPGGGWRWSWSLVAAAIFLTQLGQGAFWSLEERFGAAAGFDDHTIGLLLSLSTLSLLVGALGVAWAGTRLGRFAPLFVLTLVNALSILAIVMIADRTVFILANLMQSITNLSSVIYQLGLAASLDRSGRLVSAGTGLLTLGNGIGPSLSTSLDTVFGTVGVGLILLVLYGLALALYCLVGLRFVSGETAKTPASASGIN